MPYKDPERRRLAARKWRLVHREQRAAYMRRYRKTRSSGRPSGRPRSRDPPERRLQTTPEWADSPPSVPLTLVVESGRVEKPVSSPAPGLSQGEPTSPPLNHGELPPNTTARLAWYEPFQGFRF